MIRRIPEVFASRSLIVIFAATIVFHLFVLGGIIPFDMVWGGRLQTADEMRSFEIISIVLNILMMIVVAMRSNLIPIAHNTTIVRVLLWMMTGLFLLNTIGNLASINETEKLIFTPITFVLSILCLRLALPPEKRAT